MGGLADEVPVSGAESEPQSESVGAASGTRRVQRPGVPDTLIARLEDELGAALKRKPAAEAQLAGCVRALVPHAPRLQEIAESTLDVLVRRGSFERPLYGGLVRGLALSPSPRVTECLTRALEGEGGGGLATLSAASLSRDAALGPALARAAMTRQPHLVLAAEIARVARGESRAEHATDVAPKVKEAHRISLCVDVLVPLLWEAPLPAPVAPALALLREAERHLGRWLLMAELGLRAGDASTATEAAAHTKEGPASARQAWTLVHWALAPESARLVRPTVELVSRLSDRPSAEKDTTFLFRLAARGVPEARPMLESLCKGSAAATEVGVRAIGALALHYGQAERIDALARIVRDPKKEPLRGVALAALHAAGRTELVMELAEPLTESRKLASATWAALVLAALDGGQAPPFDEATYRRVQLGWVE
jgi:hypothetical protein